MRAASAVHTGIWVVPGKGTRVEFKQYVVKLECKIENVLVGSIARVDDNYVHESFRIRE